MAETGTEAGTGAGLQRAAAPRGFRNPRVQVNNRCALLEEGGTQICPGQCREGRKTSHAFKRGWNLVSSTNQRTCTFPLWAQDFSSDDRCASQQAISCKVLEESTPFYVPFRYVGANPAGRLGCLLCRMSFQQACF